MSAAEAAAEPAFASMVRYDLPADQYHADPALGSHDVIALLRSPAHFVAQRVAGGSDSAARHRGTATHLAVFEPEMYDRQIVVVPADAPDRPTAAMLNAKDPSPSSARRVAWWADFEAQRAGRIALPQSDHDAVRRMADAVRAHPAASTLLAAGAREVSLFWRDADTGAPGKARVDWLRPEVAAVDLKSTRDASPRGFPREAARYGYVTQAAHYDLGARAVLGKAFDFWIWIAVEPEPPYAVGVYVADADQVARATDAVVRAYATHEECARTGRWPAYSPLIEPITLPEWAL